MDAIRKLIERQVADRGLDLKRVSEMLGKNPAYLQQYLRRNIPRELGERERSRLAEILGLDEGQLGAPKRKGAAPSPEIYVTVPEYDVRVSAGDGALATAENMRAEWPFNAEYVRQALNLHPDRLAIVEVRGDSMLPTLSSGDRVMVDLQDRQVSQPGIFVLYDGGGTVIKRVEKIPGQDRIVLISDNAIHSRYEISGDDVHVVGRVVWAARRL